MGTNEQLSQTMTGIFSEGSPIGPLKVRETEALYSNYDTDNKPRSGYQFIVENDALESNPATAHAIATHIMNRLRVTEPFKSNLKLESEKAHAERLSDELEYFRLQEAEINKKSTGTSITTIPDKYPEWFKELTKRRAWNVQHALNVTRRDDGLISITIDIPSDVDPEIIVKNLEGRKAEILNGLAKRTAKYTSRTDKENVEAETKALNMHIYSSTEGDFRQVKIDIMSQERFTDMNQPGGLQVAKATTYAAQNPLTTLQNGEDDKVTDPEKPQPHLKKALARSILTTGQSYIEVFHLIAGREDMHREVGKSLAKLKKRALDNPQLLDAEQGKKLVERIDAFLNDDVFKSRQWDKPVEEQQDLKNAPEFHAHVIDVDGANGTKEKKHVMQVTVQFPADKIEEIQKQISALGNQNTMTSQPAASEPVSNISTTMSGPAGATATCTATAAVVPGEHAVNATAAGVAAATATSVPAENSGSITATAGDASALTATAGSAAVAGQITADTTQLGAVLQKPEINANLAAAIAGAGAEVAASR